MSLFALKSGDRNVTKGEVGAQCPSADGWDAMGWDRNKNIPVGAVGAQHGAVAVGCVGTGTRTSLWEQWVHSIAQDGWDM